ncbi:ATP-binding protein [Thiofilum flexile]|uniref:ATP-binding protein n=1 Tax=Thiofilum flexile TaxID=125627 RepID=UPI000370BD01|nr:ATP-binding protein [Thiofilum flexile]
MTQRKRLPIGIQTFAKIREDNYYYVDKTQLALDLTRNGTYYFLSRPRRFGKSLFLDTLKELFEGNERLFQGLAVHEHWDWSVQYPVIRFSFGGNSYTTVGQLKQDISEQLHAFEIAWQFTSTSETSAGRFKELILHVKKQFEQPVVILIDEYDKPILDAIHKPEVARDNRDVLRGFYSTIKDYDAHIKLAFFTGVSKFSKVSLFSGLNNLKDITMDSRYATICGYTDHDIDSVFAPELVGLDRQEIRAWYNGYHWMGDPVYNPFDVLLLFDKRQFKNYWFETGTPTFLIDLIRARQIATPNLARRNSDEELLSSFDIDYMPLEAVMFQTGYLTIKDTKTLGGSLFYELGYPNREVYQSLNSAILQRLVNNPNAQVSQRIQLYELLLQNDFDGLKNLFQGFFSSIPYHWYNNNDIQEYEGFYASVFYSYFASLGLEVIVEDCTNLGRIDMTLKFNHQVYIFEFKVVEMTPKGEALKQIKERGYANKYQVLNQPIYLIGVEFSRVSRNVLVFEVEEV